jgi:hypothetical protein
MLGLALYLNPGGSSSLPALLEQAFANETQTSLFLASTEEVVCEPDDGQQPASAQVIPEEVA